MHEQFAPRTRTRVKLLYAYTVALAEGDLDTLAMVLREAELDAVLERMILTLHDATLEAPLQSDLTEISPSFVSTENPSKTIAEARMHTVMGIMVDDRRAIHKQEAQTILKVSNRNISRFSIVLQGLAAVLVIGTLLGSFALLLTHHPVVTGSSRKVVSVQHMKNFIVTVADSEGKVYGLQSQNGAVLWHYDTQQEVDMMVQQRGTVYVSTLPGTSGNNLYKFRQSDGKLLWKRNFPQLSGFSVITLDGNALAISGGEGDGSLDVVNTSNGSLLWHYTPENSIWSNPMIAAHDRVLYIRVKSGMEAVQFATGKILWTSTDVSVVNGLIFNGNVMYALNSLNNTITTLDISNGKQIGNVRHFSSQDNALNGGYTTNTLYVIAGTPGITSKLCALSLSTGMSRWCVNEPQINIAQPPVVMNNAFSFLQILNNHWEVVSLSATNGKSRWHWTNPGGNSVNLSNDVNTVGASGIIFVTSPQGFFALSVSNGQVLWQALQGFKPALFALPSVPGQSYQLPS